MNRWKDRDGFPRNINSRKYFCSLRNTRETLSNYIWLKVFNVQMDKIFDSPQPRPSFISIVIDLETTSLEARSLACGVPLHEPFTLRISEIATFSLTPFGYKRPCPINPSRVELYKFHVLKWEPALRTIALPSPVCVCACTRKITSSIAAGGYNNHLRFKPVDSPIIQIPCHNPEIFPSTSLMRSRAKYSMKNSAWFFRDC